MFSYFQASGWLPQLHKTLGGGTAAQMPCILEHYPWEEIADELVVDIGGGCGGILVGLLRKHSTMQGGIFDLQHVIEHVEPFFEPEGHYGDLRDRMSETNLVAGDFFKHVPLAVCTL